MDDSPESLRVGVCVGWVTLDLFQLDVASPVLLYNNEDDDEKTTRPFQRHSRCAHIPHPVRHSSLAHLAIYLSHFSLSQTKKVGNMWGSINEGEIPGGRGKFAPRNADLKLLEISFATTYDHVHHHHLHHQVISNHQPQSSLRQ